MLSNHIDLPRGHEDFSEDTWLPLCGTKNHKDACILWIEYRHYETHVTCDECVLLYFHMRASGWREDGLVGPGI